MVELMINLILLMMPLKEMPMYDYSALVDTQFSVDRDTICVGDTLDVHGSMSLKDKTLSALRFASIIVYASCDSCPITFFSESNGNLFPAPSDYARNKDTTLITSKEPYCFDIALPLTDRDLPGEYRVHLVVGFYTQKQDRRSLPSGNIRQAISPLHVNPQRR